MAKIAVLGAGVNGLTSAIKIKEKYKNFDVVVIACEFSPNTTGDGSGGLWHPYLCGNTPHDLITKWGIETYKFLHELWKTGAHGVCMIPMYYMYRNKDNFCKPVWADQVYGYQVLEGRLLEECSELYSVPFTAGHTFTTFVSTPPMLLSYLQQRLQRSNGKLLQAKLTSLLDPMLDQYDVVVNCTGLGARWLVPDERVVPIRGQIIQVKAPWINQVIIDSDGGNYIIPNANTVVLGGTSYRNDFNTKIDPTDTDNILKGCKQMMPGLESAELVKHWVGLRPSRDSVRLEPEKNGRLYIHNYGHGGSGLTLFWGCGEEVLQILDTYINRKQNLYTSSKL